MGNNEPIDQGGSVADIGDALHTVLVEVLARRDAARAKKHKRLAEIWEEHHEQLHTLGNDLAFLKKPASYAGPDSN